MNWSQKFIDIAGDNFDILGWHNYEYEPENFETGLRRIHDYLVKLRDYIRASAHPASRSASSNGTSLAPTIGAPDCMPPAA